MLRNIKVLLLVSAMVLVAGAMGTSALTSVTIDRSMSATLSADNADAAAKILCLNNAGGTDYSGLCSYDANGVVSVSLHKAINSSGNIGFNRSASFQIGSSSANSRVIGITNNSGTPLVVYFDGAEIEMKNQADATLTAATAGSPVGDTIAAGQTREYYFTVNTPSSNAASLSGTLQIRAQ